MKGWKALTILTLSIAACGESTIIHTWPSGAKVSINSQLVGVSPVEYSVPSSQWPGTFHYRLEREGFVPQEGDLQTRLAKGRVVGQIFTLGLLSNFKRTVTLEDRYDFELVPTSDARGSNVDHGGQANPPADAPERLRQLRELLDKGLITKQEYDKHRTEILNNL